MDRKLSRHGRHPGRVLARIQFSVSKVGPGLRHSRATVLLLLLVLPLFAAEPEVLSVNHGTPKFKPADSRLPTVSDDGQVVAFESMAHLLPEDKNKESDIYVLDRRTGKLKRVVARDPSRRNGGPAVRGDGNAIAFHSYIRVNKKKVDIPQSADLCVYDARTDTVTTPLTAFKGTEIDGESIYPRWSADGDQLLFVSNSTQLAPQSKDAISQIYSFNLREQELTLISKNGENDASNRLCGNPRVSADGQKIAYLSNATNFAPPLPPSALASHLYYYDCSLGTTTRIDVFEKGFDANEWFVGAFDMDASGNTLVFEARHRVPGDPGKTLRSSDLFLYDRVTDKVSLLTTGLFANKSHGPSLSADGNYIAFALYEGDGVVINERSSDRWLKVADGHCENLEISKNGSVVVFDREGKKTRDVYLVKNPFKEQKK